MSNQPLDKGRVVFVAEKYQTSEIDQTTGQPKMKNRYAAAGRATKWPSQTGGENIEIEIDAMPVGATGSVKLHIFWDSENQQNQVQQQGAPMGQNGGGFNQNQQQQNGFVQQQYQPQN